ncbi:MAG: hypothetical protein Ct9H300mP12_02550 [Acidimicrobiales bacterium]|nr:MAG: hypothetical protein Ct9H300mP12_02550 [Acidimicrobiales bacterium]
MPATTHRCWRGCARRAWCCPQPDGISHNPAEHTEPDDLVAGADVLLQTILTLDRMVLESDGLDR